MLFVKRHKSVIPLLNDSEEDNQMRGDDQQQDGLFSYLSPEQRVPRNHPLRRLRPLVDEVLGALSSRFNKMYARVDSARD